MGKILTLFSLFLMLNSCEKSAYTAEKKSTEEASSAPSSASKTEAIKGIKPAPDFELKDAKGKKHRLSALKGQVLFVHFWAKWCPPCIEEIPVLLEVAKTLKGKKFTMVMVSMDDNWEDAHAILPSQGLPENMISVLDEDQKVTRAYGSYQFPETYFINQRFEIVTKWIGPQNWNDKEFVEYLKKLIDKPLD